MGFDYVVEGKIMCAPKESLGGNQPIIRGGHLECAPWGGEGRGRPLLLELSS